MTDAYGFTGESARRVVKAVKTVEANDPLYTGPKPRRRQKYVRQSFFAKITGSSEISTNRWKYAWTEQQRTATGFQDKPNGRSGTTADRFAINSVEASNDGSDTEGNSVDVDGTIFDDNSGLEMQPVEGNPVVTMWFDYDDEGNPAYTFEYVNAIDGECGSEE
jgi:hypothetical protein